MSEHRTDILISRILDRVETQDEWAEFRTLAATEPSAWELLAEAQRDNERLVALARAATLAAEYVELPGDDAALRPFRLSRHRAGLGWAAAAVILLAWVASGPASRLTGESSQAGLGSFSADDAYQRYLAKGQADGVVVGEVEPKMLLNSKELPNGGFEVIFVRQVIERRRVPTLVQMQGTDERGAVVPVPVHPTRPGSM